MKKKSERCSFKKLNPSKREEARFNNDSILNDKKKSIKAKSS